jgi:hypothetical protein
VPNQFKVSLVSSDKNEEVTVSISRLVIAGWAGRNRAELQHHIEELAQLGVPAPKTTPEFYKLSSSRVTADEAIEVIGSSSSGEVEAVVLAWNGKLWVGVGSDHTDRDAERHGIALSKQVCDKPVAPILWAFEDLKSHWDQLEVRSYILEQDKWTLYQQGFLSSLLPISDLIAKYSGATTLEDGTVMFCGTVAAIGGIRPATAFEMELHDPVLKRAISHRYVSHEL